MVPGPYCWCLLADFHALGRHYGQAASFPRLTDLCLAARTRLKIFENGKHGGLGIKDKSEAIRLCISRIESTKRYSRWFSWFQHSVIEDIRGCESELEHRGLTIRGLLDAAAGPAADNPSREDEEKRRLRQKRCFQKTVRKKLDARTFIDATERMRHKLNRWNLEGIPAYTASRCIRALQQLTTWVPPRVCSAVLRTVWNGWCTRRRFQQRGSCCFGCGSFSHDDSIEHYAHCPVVWRCAKKCMRIHPTSDHRGQFVVLGLNESTSCKEEVIARALWVYAAYRAHNILRFSPLAPGETADDLLKQLLKEGVMGHPDATAFLDYRWATGNYGYAHNLGPRDDLAAAELDLDIFE